MQAVILAAGEGTRVRPLTRGRPKALIPVANRPVIDYCIDALQKNGIREIIVVVGYRKEQVISHLNSLEIPLKYVVQDRQIGTAHALQCAAPLITGDFLVVSGDNYIGADSITRIQAEKNALLVKEHPSPSNFGVVLAKDGYIREILEKPDVSPGYTVSTGIYSLTREFLPYLQNETRMTDAVSRMIADGGRIKIIESEDWQDAIYPWDFLTMNRALLKQMPSVKAGEISRNAVLQGPVSIGKGSVVGPNTTITGPVIIGEDCTIGPNTCVLPGTSIGSRVRLEPFSCIGNAIVMDDSVIGSHSRILDSVIGPGCTLADHISTESEGCLLEINGIHLQTKFGAVLGDAVRVKPFTVFRNCLVGNGVSVTRSHRSIGGIIRDETVVM